MNIKTLNIVSLDDGLIIKKGGASGGGTTPSKPKYTGHADAEGLRAIGWTDEDIAYYQENGVNWNEEDDEYHKVTDDNKALYGVLTASNISTYKDRIVYLPKIDTSGVTDMYKMFYTCYRLVAIPQLDTSKVTNMDSMFYQCYSLVLIPPLDTSSVTSSTGMSSMFYECYSLTFIPMLDTSRVRDTNSMFSGCYSLTSIPPLDLSSTSRYSYMFRGCRSLVSTPILTGKPYSVMYAFDGCYSLISIPMLDMSGASNTTGLLSSCYSLIHLKLHNINSSLLLSASPLLSKESLLYLINNEAAERAITITLASYAYDRWATDADVVAALEAHPNISISK